jgi:hypothetical protein
MTFSITIAATQSEVKVMKWEYLQVMMTVKPVKEGHGRLVVLGGGQPGVQVGVGKRLIDLLGELGAEGWELAGVMDMSAVEQVKEDHDLYLTHSSLLLKRPVA